MNMLPREHHPVFPKLPHLVDREIMTIAEEIYPDEDWNFYGMVFADTVCLFDGTYPGYQACNTPYHDLYHTMGTALATARLLHGLWVEGLKMPKDLFEVGIVAALLHDVGYIQTSDDTEGTGAKYTLTHVTRSADFLDKYFRTHGRSETDVKDARDMILCTELAVSPRDIRFRNPAVRTLAQALATSDLLSQMSDTYYLEKLPSLYEEFVEGDVPGFESEYDMFQKTGGFYSFIRQRLETALGNVMSLMPLHFQATTGERRDYYDEFIGKNMAYLEVILKESGPDYRSRLRRKVPRAEAYRSS